MKKDKTTALILWLFLGGFSAHRFYAGRYWTAILQMLTFGGFGFWLIIDLILIVTGNLVDKNGHKIDNWN